MGKTLSKIDLYVKKTVLSDTMHLTKKSRAKINEISKFNSLERILPILEDEKALEVYETLSMVRNLYLAIAPVKSKQTITSSNFEKLL